jgi:hypothetical protein
LKDPPPHPPHALLPMRCPVVERGGQGGERGRARNRPSCQVVYTTMACTPLDGARAVWHRCIYCTMIQEATRSRADLVRRGGCRSDRHSTVLDAWRTEKSSRLRRHAPALAMRANFAANIRRRLSRVQERKLEQCPRNAWPWDWARLSVRLRVWPSLLSIVLRLCVSRREGTRGRQASALAVVVARHMPTARLKAGCSVPSAAQRHQPRKRALLAAAAAAPPCAPVGSRV